MPMVKKSISLFGEGIWSRVSGLYEKATGDKSQVPTIFRHRWCVIVHREAKLQRTPSYLAH